MSNTHSLSTLPFVKSAEDGAIISLWNVAPSGDWGMDIKTGQTYAQGLVTRMSGSGSTSALFHIAKAMSRSKFSGIECGFFSHIGLAAIS